MGDIYKNKDRWSRGNIMWASWNRFLLDQEMQRHESSLHFTLMLTSQPCMYSHSTSHTCWRHSSFTATLRGESSKHTLPKWPLKAPSVKGKHNNMSPRTRSTQTLHQVVTTSTDEDVQPVSLMYTHSHHIPFTGRPLLDPRSRWPSNRTCTRYVYICIRVLHSHHSFWSCQRRSQPVSSL